MQSTSEGVPVNTAWRGRSDILEAEDGSPSAPPCNPVPEPGGWSRPTAPSEADARGLTPESTALNPSIGSPAHADAPGAPVRLSHSPRPEFRNNGWLPPLSLLHPADSAVAPMTQDDLIDGGILIEEKLAEFRVKVNVQDAYAGPVITRYEVQPAIGVRGGQVVSLMKDLARALGVVAIRVVETIPGKTCMGLELPNPRRQMIHLSEVLSSEVFQSHPSKLAMALGKDITGEPVVADLARAPHMLVAGTTGSGKSVGVNAMILSLLYRATPDEVRFVMIDPKMLELSIYDGIPHLLAPVVTDMKLAANALTWCVGEMERRYRLMSVLRVRNLAGYNEKVREAVDTGELLVDPFSLTQDNPTPLAPLPYVVVVVDELADLMMVAGKKIEELVARLAQKARAAGIHLIIATQRPSVDVITGLIKANIPTRIAFQVSSKIDSRTILDQMGAECLLGQGDMLYLPPGTGYPQRVHGAFVPDEDVYAVAEYLKQRGEPDYVEGVLNGMSDAEEGVVDAERFGEEADPLYDDAVAFVISSRRASISSVQRQLRIGYNRAARLVEQMEAAGLVSPMESNGNRTVLVPPRPD
jgi:S-DNA-T family DNA segregation ATPase FtsK/SpoIIIE